MRTEVGCRERPGKSLCARVGSIALRPVGSSIVGRRLGLARRFAARIVDGAFLEPLDDIGARRNPHARTCKLRIEGGLQRACRLGFAHAADLHALHLDAVVDLAVVEAELETGKSSEKHDDDEHGDNGDLDARTLFRAEVHVRVLAVALAPAGAADIRCAHDGRKRSRLLLTALRGIALRRHALGRLRLPAGMVAGRVAAYRLIALIVRIVVKSHNGRLLVRLIYVRAIIQQLIEWGKEYIFSC